ncbi:hypothetical protein ACFXOY_28120 [Streptomyces niveus]|uniref:hypothetical protein n=1 Tax=Streptomyces niveus TaxID=193462 RepID=UPI0036ABD107
MLPVTDLRTEMRDVRAALEALTPSTPHSGTETRVPSYVPTALNTPNSAGSMSHDMTPTPPLVTAPEHDEPAQPLRVSIPLQRDGSNSEPQPGVTGLPPDLIQQALRDVVSEELAPIFTLLAEWQDGQDDRAAAVRDDVRAHVGETVRELREELDAARQETRAGLEQLLPEPDGENTATEVSDEHSELLKHAARVSSVDLLCPATSGSSSPPKRAGTRTSGCHRKSPTKATSGSGPPCPGAP